MSALNPAKRVANMHPSYRIATPDGIRTVRPTPEAKGRDSAGRCRAERDLQEMCNNFLNALGIIYHHLSDRAREDKGYPDLTFCYHGRPIAVELKSHKGRLSKEQRMKLTLMSADKNGWETYVVDSLEDFRRVLDGTMAQWRPMQGHTMVAIRKWRMQQKEVGA